MTFLLVYWFGISSVALYFSVMKFLDARVAQQAEGLTIPERYQRDWRYREALWAVAISGTFLSADLVAALDVLLAGVQLAAVTILLLSLAATFWAFARVDDERSHDALAYLLAHGS